MRKIMLPLALLAVASVCHAAPRSEVTFTADGGYRIVGVNARGPLLIEARAEGDTAGIWIGDTSQIAPTVVLRDEWPSVGYSYFKLYPGEPQPFYFASGAPDTIWVEATVATEVKVRWTFED